ncbi:MAG: efflux RND transporter periplasmic adaptor subunit [Gemmatimonadales bacterium]
MTTLTLTPTGSDRAMTMNRSIFRAALRAAPVMLLLAACGGKAKSGAPAEVPPVQVSSDNVTVVDSSRLESGPALSGSLEAERAAQLRAQVGGAVLALYVDQGAAVHAGQALALIDTSAIAESARSARSALRSAQASADVAKRNAERSDALHQAGAIADRDLEAARSSAVAADANLADARSRLASAEKMLSNATIRAPFNGIVSERPASVGDVVQPGSPVLTVVDPSLLKLEASVPAEDIAALKAGSKVEFTIQGSADKTFTGKISRINPAVDPATRQVRVYVSVANTEHALVSGLFAEGRVALKSLYGLAIPFTAIDQRATTPSVKRVRGGKVESVPVTLGLRDELAEQVQVLSGVSKGDTLLIGGVLGTPAGVMLRITRRDR